ncbi:GNAT family N-acetyltransferase [Dyadobacter sp. CY312]|uniref:GNAT family N-acetyltransferase n=1 Tax=Dyadobacter sp. CY312 TaxID=2907303 RepID=UPI001F2E28E0|nr:GNAT family N-acetyltransferase [Dyadobacter sp. CY312]MCE7041721.1 GNAT family N-acetyltransferase [Dyadobacter sp. CY312]
MINVKTLETTGLAIIAEVFNAAFADYFVPFHVDQHYLYKRWKAASVDYKLSFGAFDGDQLVGFLVFGVDQRDGKRTAHNAATGVVPAYRGNGLVRRMYEAALPLLKLAGVQYSTLEVITRNEIAIKAYTGIGYSVRRTLLCFSGKLNLTGEQHLQLTKIKEIPAIIPEEIYTYPDTWEQSEKALRIANPDYEFWFIEEAAKMKAYAIVNPESGYIARFGFANGKVLPYGEQLFSAIGTEFSLVKINNVDSTESELADFLSNAGLSNHINQYEMVMEL